MVRSVNEVRLQRSLARVASVLLLAIASSPQDAAATIGSDHVREILIESRETGWGSNEAQIRIVRDGAGFRSEMGVVRTRLIDRLLDRITAAPIPEPSLETIPVLRSDLVQAAGRYCEESIYQTGDAATDARLRERCRSRLEDTTAFERCIKPYYDSRWTDDYADMTVTITLDDGRVFRASSTAQHQLMIPWSIAGPGVERTTYDPKLSEAIADLLPRGFVNLGRLLGESLVHDILRRVHFEIRSELDGIAAEGLFGDWLDGVREHFEITESSLALITSIDIGDPVDPEGRWHGRLRAPEMPTNLDFEASIQRHRAPSVSQFSRELQSYRRALEDVEWLWRAVAEFPNVDFGIRYVDGRSLSPKAEAVLRSDLETTNRGILDRLTPGEISSVLFVTASVPRTKAGDCGYSRWLVLRTGESLLWQFAGNDPLRLRIHPVPAADCALRPAGILIDPSGRPVPREQPRRSALGSP